jgi:hypothetical protein
MEVMKMLKVQGDRAVALGLAAVGALCLLLGWIGVSTTSHVAVQLPYFISGGLFGIFLLAIACVTWISADLRDEWRELHALRTTLDADLALRTKAGLDAAVLDQIQELDTPTSPRRKRAAATS